MNKTNPSQSSPWIFFVKLVKKGFQILKKSSDDFNSKYPNLLQIIQLSFIYWFALVDLTYSVLLQVYALGSLPEIFRDVSPFFEAILTFPAFKIFGAPEKTFLLSYIVIELMIVRSFLKFSKLVRYNVLLLFILIMFQGVLMSYWDLLFHRQIVEAMVKWSFDQGAIIFLDKPLATFFFSFTFVAFFFFYCYLYIEAIRGKIFTCPGLYWLTDSVCFWLRIRTPTMNIGQRKPKKKK
jgi:hypothetical protein